MNSSATHFLHNPRSLCHKRFVLLGCLFFVLAGLKAQQVGIYSDVFVASDATLAIHSPETHFINGIIDTPENNPGRVSFVALAHGVSPHRDSHVEADVLSHGHANFIFPVGDSQVYQPLQIQDGTADDLTVSFKLLGHSALAVTAPIEQLSNNFYWTVEGSKNARLSLSWNTASNLSQLTDELDALLIAGFNGSEWEMIPAMLEPFTFEGDNNVTSLSEGAITTTGIVDFSNYSAVTLAAKAILTEIQVSQAITPNGDDRNDIWYIENIERYPTAIIRVYNRWGAQVFFQAGNYNNNWGGTFENSSKPLPPAPYFYRIDLDADGAIDHEGWIYINH